MADSYTVTDFFRTIVARMYSRNVAEVQREITLFKIGEGGWEGSPKVPKTPSAAREDLESEGEPLAGGGKVVFMTGSFQVVGLGTSFLSDVTPGQWVKPGPASSVVSNYYSAGEPGTEYDDWGQVLSVTDDENLVLSSVYTGASCSANDVRECYKASTPFFTFRKTLAAGDVLWGTATGVDVAVLVDFAEANATQLGVAPAFFEVGLFDSDGCMVAYGTFDERTKTVGVQIILPLSIGF